MELVADYQQHEVLIAVDLKAAGVEQEVVRLAERYEVLHRLIFIGSTISEPSVRERIRAASAQAQTAAVANTPEEFRQALDDEHATWVYFRFLPTSEQMEAVRSARKRGFIAGATVSGNLAGNWQHALDVGIDGILTDFPLELRSTLRGHR